MAWVPAANPASVMSSIIRSRNGVIEVSLHWSIEPADLRQPMQRILSVAPPRDTAILRGEAVQSNGRFLRQADRACVTPDAQALSPSNKPTRRLPHSQVRRYRRRL